MLIAFSSNSLFQPIDKIVLDKKATRILERLKKSPETIGEIKLFHLNSIVLQTKNSISISLPDGKTLKLNDCKVETKDGGCKLFWKNKENLVSITAIENSAIGLIYFENKVYSIEPLSLTQSVHVIRQIDQRKLKD
jgi:hypothetical protein